jgi:hypothetical protein
VKRWLVLLLLAVVSTVSCGRGERPAATSNEPAAAQAGNDDETPQDGGTVIRRLDTDVSGLNPILAVSLYDRHVAQYENHVIHFAGDYKNMYLLEADWVRKFEAVLSRSSR